MNLHIERYLKKAGRAQNETPIRNEGNQGLFTKLLREYDYRIDFTYHNTLNNIVAGKLNPDLPTYLNIPIYKDEIPENVRIERFTQLRAKLIEYNQRWQDKFILEKGKPQNQQRTFEQVFENTRYRRDLLRFILKDGLVNPRALVTSYTQNGTNFNLENVINDCIIIKDYLLTGGRTFHPRGLSKGSI